MPETFDVVTIEREFLGRTSERGAELGKDEYHVVVMAMLINPESKILMTKRSQNKTAPGKWECTAGSVVAGETSRDAMIREIREEIGIDVEILSDSPIAFFIEDDAIFDIWEIPTTKKIEDLILQSSEVDEAKYADLGEMKSLVGSGQATASVKEIIRTATLARGLVTLDSEVATSLDSVL